MIHTSIPSVRWYVAVVLAALLGWSVPALAQSQSGGIKYNYVQGGYQNVDPDGGGDGDGLYLGGSWLVSQSVFLSGDYDYVDFNGGVDIQGLELGVGFRLPATPNVDVVLQGGLAHAEVDTNVGDFDDTGYFASAGARWRVNERVELNGALKYVDVDDLGDDEVLELGGEVDLQRNLAIRAGIEIGDDADAIKLGLRYYFDR